MTRFSVILATVTADVGLNVLIDEVKDGNTLLHIDIEFKSETDTFDTALIRTSVTCVFSERSGSTLDDVFEPDKETAVVDVVVVVVVVAVVEFDELVVFNVKLVRLVLSKPTTRKASCELPLNN